MSLVTVRNVGDDTVTVGDVTIEAGKEAELDRDLVVSQLGAPGGGPADLTRVQTIWGFYAGFAPDDQWVETAPKLEVYEDGNRLWLLHDDPTGEHAAEEAAKPKKSASKAAHPTGKAASKK